MTRDVPLSTRNPLLEVSLTTIITKLLQNCINQTAGLGSTILSLVRLNASNCFVGEICCISRDNGHTDATGRIIDRLSFVSHSTQNRSFWTRSSHQSLSTVLKKLNLTQQKQPIQEQNSVS